MTVKKIIFFILFFIFLFTDGLFAAPASPDFEEIKQPDGKGFKAKLKGDEFYHWHEDENGYTVIKDTVTKFWTYAKKHKSGHLEKSEFKAGNDIPVGIAKNLKDENMLLKAADYRQKISSQHNTSSLLQKSSVSSNKAPSSVSSNITNIKNLVILVEFSDKKYSLSPEDINKLYNDINYTTDGAAGSVKDYYNEISYGKFDIEFIVSTFVVTLDKSYTYYGKNNSFGSDSNPREMITDTVAKLNEMGFDFAQADGNNDGKVDAFTVVHAGCGEETGSNSDNIWSHQDYVNAKTWDNKKVFAYTTVPELRGTESSSAKITRIGVIVHELMHIFDVPDLYDTTYQSSGLGNFCLMSYGLWNGNDGKMPAHPCAWVKYKLGFIQPGDLSKGKNTIETSANSDTAFYKISPDNFNPKEYFMIENRQPYGFDKGLPGGNSSANRGLLIYHIDERQSDKKIYNNDRTHYFVALEEADAKTSDWTLFDLAQNNNKGTPQDYFRNTTITTFNDDNRNSPNSLSYNLQKSEINIFDISASDDIMYFWTPDYETFIKSLDDNRGLVLLNMIMGFSKTKEELINIDETTKKEISKYFTFTPLGAAEANNMYDIYNEYNESGTVFGIPKDKMSVLIAVNANLVNKLNYALRTSSGTQTINSVGVISFADDAPIENNNISGGQNMRFTGTGVLEDISGYLKEYGYLMPKFNTMEINSLYTVNEVFENTDVTLYKDYKFFAGKKTAYTYDLSKIVCYPNPARNGKITITNLPSISDNLNIYIFTISAQMVTSFSLDDTQMLGNGTRFLVWNCKTKSGNDVAQGVYIVLIKNSGNKTTKKIAVIR